ncbi:DUF3606 domain-containing protein [Sinorhizobium americanum]|uniref:Uncharacterized protein n=1 Tax=Sinorhizobium americanum TaxID=194963 RepID=A0A1L3LSD6_9HYPH|nr:DUF3606 domain-containing protein [Sinorhizobium americanum]APG93008.1 hypothetical protein SAMCFNEI73_pA0031 [Sinorhizobium americanum]OAP43369.1 hypothetical protein ATC00_24585 [Sinorhizobium americanum]
MARDVKKKGRDSEFVSTQEHEIAYLMQRTNKAREEVLKAIREVGPDRQMVMDYLSKGPLVTRSRGK